MDKWLFLIVIIFFLFMITYDPKSHTLDKYILGEHKEHYAVGPQATGNCCDNVDYMADNYRQCAPAHFQGIQFAEPYGCPSMIPVTNQGAILHN